MIRRCALLGLACVLSLDLCGCSSGESGRVANSASQAERVPDESKPEHPTVSPAATGPMNERDQMRREQLAQATKGIRFENERVVVVERLAGDVAAAEQQMQRGRELMEWNAFNECVAAFTLAIRQTPSEAEPYFLLGKAMLLKGKSNEAMAAFQTAVALDSKHREALFELALHCSRASRMDEAVEVMNRLVELDPEHARAHERLAIWLYYRDDLAGSWQHVAAVERTGGIMPPQFVNLLASRMPRP